MRKKLADSLSPVLFACIVVMMIQSCVLFFRNGDTVRGIFMVAVIVVYVLWLCAIFTKE